MSDYYIKYNQYKAQYLELKYQLNNLQKQSPLFGGQNDNDDIDDIADIKLLVQKKGNTFWYNSRGNLLVNTNSDTKAKNELLSILKKNINNYLNKNLINVKIIFWEDNEEVISPIEISIKILTVKSVLGKIALNKRDKQHSFIRIFLEPDEFNLSDIKKLSKTALDKKLDDGIEYTYDDIKKYLKN